MITMRQQGLIHNNTIITGFQHRWLADSYECDDIDDKYITDDVTNGFECGYRCRVATGTNVWSGQKAGEDCNFVDIGYKGNKDGDCYREMGDMCWDQSKWSNSGNGKKYMLYKMERRRK